MGYGGGFDYYPGENTRNYMFCSRPCYRSPVSGYPCSENCGITRVTLDSTYDDYNGAVISPNEFDLPIIPGYLQLDIKMAPDEHCWLGEYEFAGPPGGADGYFFEELVSGENCVSNGGGAPGWSAGAAGIAEAEPRFDLYLHLSDGENTEALHVADFTLVGQVFNASGWGGLASGGLILEQTGATIRILIDFQNAGLGTTRLATFLGTGAKLVAISVKDPFASFRPIGTPSNPGGSLVAAANEWADSDCEYTPYTCPYEGCHNDGPALFDLSFPVRDFETITRPIAEIEAKTLSVF